MSIDLLSFIYHHPVSSPPQFGGGMRMCIGQSFAIKEAKIIFAMILQRFTVAPVPAQCIAPSVAVTMRPRHGLLVDVTPVRAI